MLLSFKNIESEDAWDNRIILEICFGFIIDSMKLKFFKKKTIEDS